MLIYEYVSLNYDPKSTYERHLPDFCTENDEWKKY